MADPLSIAGSIAGLVSIGDVLFRKLYHYVKDVKNAEKEIKELKSEIAALTGMLHNLHIIAVDLEADNTRSYSIRLDHVSSCLGTLHKLNDELTQNDLSAPTKGKKTLQKLAWPFKSIDLRNYVAEIHQHRDNLSFALAADSFTTLVKCLTLQENISTQLSALQAAVTHREEIETRIQLDDEARKILDYFLIVNPQTNFRTSVQLRYPTTGFWLKSNDTYTQWFGGSGKLLWLSGIPGAGKTVLSGLIVEDCLDQMTIDRSVAFFYCDYKDKQSQNIVNILSALASQLARQNEASFKLLKAYYTRLHPPTMLKRSPEIPELADLLQEMCSTFEDVRIVVDGLDECGESAGELSQLLVSLQSNNDNVSAAFFSRAETDIKDAFSKTSYDHVEIAAQSKDLDHYVRSELEHRITNKKIRIRSPGLKEEIIKQLVERADGMFRWVSCQLDHLCDLPTDIKRRKALEQLPVGLNETYERLLMRIRPSWIVLVCSSLVWIAQPYPKINMEQLVDILSLEDDGTLDPEARPDPEDVFRMCSSLIRRTNNGDPELAHFTVLEFLKSIQPDDPRLSQFCLSFDDQTTMAQVCVEYLCASQFDRIPPTNLESQKEIIETYPFYTYAAKFVEWLSIVAQEHSELLESLQRLFDPDMTFNFMNFATYICTIYTNSRWSFIGWSFENVASGVCSRGFSPLHLAAMLDSPALCDWLLDQGCEVNQQSLFGTPLQCAVSRQLVRNGLCDREKRTEIVSCLLKAGADWNANAEGEVNSLPDLIFKHSDQGVILECLKYGMELDLDVFSRHNNSGNWDFATESMRNALSSDGMTSGSKAKLLQWMTNEDITPKMDLPSSACATDDVFFESVVFAIRFDRSESLKNLMKDSRFTKDTVVPSAQGGGTLLHLAIRSGASEVMELLLNHECDTESVDCRGETVWHLALASRSPKVVKLLLEKKGNNDPMLNARSQGGYTPLLEAIIRDYEETAIVLLEALDSASSINLDAEIVHYAVARGLEGFLGFLHQHNVPLDITSEDGRNALYFFTSSTPSTVLELLLAGGLDPCHRDKEGKTPLHAFLAHDQRIEHIERARHKFSHMDTAKTIVASVNSLPEDTVKKLTTAETAKSTDNAGMTPWYYFCTKTVPYILGSKLQDKLKYLLQLWAILEENGACTAYDQTSDIPTAILLVDMCLSVPEASPQDITKILIHSFRQNRLESKHLKDVQLVRVLVWSVSNYERSLTEVLVKMGICASAPHKGLSAVDVCCTSAKGADILELLLGNANFKTEPPPADSEARWLYGLCGAKESDRPASLAKMELLLRCGVNPNLVVGKDNGLTAVLWAANNDFLEAVQLLHRHHANIQCVVKYGWGIVAYTTWVGNVSLLSYLRENLSKSNWTLRFSFRIPTDKNTRPLPQNDYHDCNAIHLAAMSFDLTMMKELYITGYYELDAISREGLTPLHFGACSRDPVLLKWLISNGANVHIASKRDKKTALHIAMALGNLRSAVALIEAGARFPEDSFGTTPEMLAHDDIRGDLVELLPQCGVAIPEHVIKHLEKPRVERLSLGLHQAIEMQNLEACRSIIQRGYPLNQPLECCYCTPFTLAVVTRSAPIVELFLSRGASSEGWPCPGAESQWNLHGLWSTVLIAITRTELNPTLERLLQIFLHHSAHWIYSDISPFCVAAAFNAEAIPILFKYMQEHEAAMRRWSRSFSARCKSGETLPLTMLNNQTKSISTPARQWLVTEGTALHVAAQNRNPEAVRHLLAYGAEVNALSQHWQTPLHIAAISGCVESARLLLKHSANRRSRNISRQTAFMLACKHGNTATMCLLADPALDRNDIDVIGFSSLHLSMSGLVTDQKKLETSIYLLDNGWDPYLRDLTPLAKTPVMMAFGHTRTCTYAFARAFDFSHLLETREQGSSWLQQCLLRTFALRSLIHRLPMEALSRWLGADSINLAPPLCRYAASGLVEEMEIFLRAGANIEKNSHTLGTALNAACANGQLAAIQLLIRRGAKLQSTFRGNPTNAIQAAKMFPDSVGWLLVGRYTDQLRITNTSANVSEGTEQPCKSWSGIRQMEIELSRRFDRQHGVSSLQHAVFLRRYDWEYLVPLNWEPVKHFVPTIEEVRASVEGKEVLGRYGIS